MKSDAFEKNGFEVIRGALKSSAIDELNSVLELARIEYVKLIPPGTPCASGYEMNRWILVSDLLERLEITPAFQKIVRKIARFVPARPVFRADLSFFKCLEAAHYESAKIGWHRDADAAGTGHYARVVNAWVPLQAVGGAAPSLEFISGSHLALRSIPTKFCITKEYELPQDPCIADAIRAGESFCPSLLPGDILLFDHHTLHRTQPVVGAQERRSFECRFEILPNPTILRRLRQHLRLRERLTKLANAVG